MMDGFLVAGEPLRLISLLEQGTFEGHGNC